MAGLDRWSAEIAAALAGATTTSAPSRSWRPPGTGTRAWPDVPRRAGPGPHDERIRETLAAGFTRYRATPSAAVLGTGTDAAGLDAAGLALALFDGLLFQMAAVDPSLAIEGATIPGRRGPPTRSGHGGLRSESNAARRC